MSLLKAWGRLECPQEGLREFGRYCKVGGGV